MYSKITIRTKFLDEDEYFYFIEDFSLFSMNQYIKLPNDNSEQSMLSCWGSSSDFEDIEIISQDDKEMEFEFSCITKGYPPHIFIEYMNIQPYIEYFVMDYNFFKDVKYDLHYAFLQDDYSNNRQLFERNYNIFIQITSDNFTVLNLLDIFNTSLDIRIKKYKLDNKVIHFPLYNKFIELDIDDKNIKCIHFKSTKFMDEFFWTFDEISHIQNYIFNLIGKNCSLIFNRK